MGATRQFRFKTQPEQRWATTQLCAVNRPPRRARDESGGGGRKNEGSGHPNGEEQSDHDKIRETRLSARASPWMSDPRASDTVVEETEEGRDAMTVTVQSDGRPMGILATTITETSMLPAENLSFFEIATAVTSNRAGTGKGV